VNPETLKLFSQVYVTLKALTRLMVGIRILKNSQKSRKFFGLSWLLPFYTYPANCLVFYLLSSMVFTATVCQVYVSGSAGTEVVVVVQTPIGRENFFAIH
jgi:hypothetical protein